MSRASRLDEPDTRLTRWGWLAFAVWTVLGGMQLRQALRAGDAGLVGVALTAPLWAMWLLWLLWRGLAALRRAIKRRAYGRWHGNYYGFDGRGRSGSSSMHKRSSSLPPTCSTHSASSRMLASRSVFACWPAAMG